MTIVWNTKMVSVLSILLTNLFCATTAAADEGKVIGSLIGEGRISEVR